MNRGAKGFALALCMGACTGSIVPGRGENRGSSAGSGAEPGNASGQGGPGGGLPGGPGVPGTSGAPLSGGAPGPTALRRLTNEEYRNTIADLLGLAGPPADVLQPETRSNGYDNFGAALTVSATLAGQYEDLAGKLAAQIDATKAAPCAAGAAEATCVSSFVRSFGKRAFRRPLTMAEEKAYGAIFEAGKAGATYADGIRALVEAFLASPKLLYRTELGSGAPGTRRLLGPYEIASELSYLFTGTMPDAELFAAADGNALGTPAQVEAQARRLLKSPRARAPLRRFLVQWMGIADLDQVSKDPAVFPQFTPALRAAMRAESERFIDAVVWERGGALSALLTSPSTFVSTDLAKLYGVADPGKGATLAPVDLNPAQRAGILTHASVLAVHSKPSDSFPIARGKFIRKQLLCQALPPPPPGANIVVPPPSPNLTTRERFAQHSQNPTCAGCHRLIDPLGFGLESYDAIGAYRTTENGRPVDAAGTITGTPDADGPYSGGVELARKLASSVTSGECAAIQAMRFGFGRLESDSDRAVAATLASLLGGGRMDLRELMVGLTRTESFFLRTAQP